MFAQKPTPSTEAVKQVQVMNALLGQQVQLAQHGWDPTVTKDSPDAELRKYYATGEPTKAMREEAKKKAGDKTLSGKESIDDLINGLITSFNESPDFQTGDITFRVNKAEGVGDNPESTASGHGQFIEDTWLDVFKKHFPEEAKGKTDAEILDLRNNKEWGDKMTAAYGQDNGKALTDAGLPVNDTSISLSHFLGVGGGGKVKQNSTGAIEVLTLAQSNPSIPIKEVLTSGVINANKTIKFAGKLFPDFTVGDLINWARERVSG
jgi:hypothetical protein